MSTLKQQRQSELESSTSEDRAPGMDAAHAALTIYMMCQLSICKLIKFEIKKTILNSSTFCLY